MERLGSRPSLADEIDARLQAGVLHYRSERVEGADGSHPWTDLPSPLPHAFELFLDALAGRRGLPLVTPREAADRVAVMEALYQSATRDRWTAPPVP
jgi:predicted dehydrogenase